MRISVQAVPRPDLTGWWTPHRHWPSAQARVVDVGEGADDPTSIVDVLSSTGHPTGEKKSIPDPFKIGQKTYRQLMESPQLVIVREVDDATPLEDAKPLEVSPADLRHVQESIAALHRRVEELAGENEKLRAKLDRKSKD